MGDSLKDQLIALGLARPDREGPAKRKPKAGGKGAAAHRKPSRELSLEAAFRLREQEEIQTAEQKKRDKQEQDRLRRQINAEIQQIVDAYAQNDPAADLKRNFLYKGRIRSALVTEVQLKALNAGELGLVFLRGSYYVMAPEQVEAVRVLSPDHVPDLAVESAEEEEEFPVPDDLMW